MMCRTKIRRRNQKYGIMSDNTQRCGNPVLLLHKCVNPKCPYYSKRKTGVKTMSDTYFDLPSRLEDSFPEIDSDIVTDLRKTSEEYDEIQQQISDLKKRFPCIMKVMEDKGEIHPTSEEHAAFVQCLRLSRKLDDMERLQLYFRGHSDAVAYLKKIKAI